VNLSALSPQQREAVETSRAQDIHAAVVAEGCFSILDFWDSIPWLNTGSDWTPWRAFVAALYGLPMTPLELEIYRACTGRQKPPEQKAKEGWMIVGRRGRKSAAGSVIASYEAAFRDHSKYLAPGEEARIPIVGKNKDDATTIKSFVANIFGESSLSFLLQSEPTAEEVKLTNRCGFKITAATINAGRSKTVPFAMLDELAFFRSEESANPDVDIAHGIEGGMTAVPGAMLLGFSSPYAKRGLLYQKYREHFGRERSDILVWKAPTLVMHPANPAIVVHVAKAYEDDPTSAKAEYGAEFRDDVTVFLPVEVIEAATDKGVTRRPYVPGVQYVGFCDPSGGTSDSMTLSIAHYENGIAVQDVLDEEHAPFVPSEVVGRFAARCQGYGVTIVEGDRYAGIWPTAEFAKKGRIRSTRTGTVYEHKLEAEAAGVRSAEMEAVSSVIYFVSDQTRRELYKNMLPLMTSSRAKLLDNKRLKVQLEALDRKTAAGGDIIDHPPGGHDDAANVTAGALLRADRLRMLAKTPPPPLPKTTKDILKQQMAASLKASKSPKKSKVNPWAKS
jgi:hypothetical protein